MHGTMLHHAWQKACIGPQKVPVRAVPSMRAGPGCMKLGPECYCTGRNVHKNPSLLHARSRAPLRPLSLEVPTRGFAGTFPGSFRALGRGPRARILPRTHPSKTASPHWQRQADRGYLEFRPLVKGFMYKTKLFRRGVFAKGGSNTLQRQRDSINCDTSLRGWGGGGRAAESCVHT